LGQEAGGEGAREESDACGGARIGTIGEVWGLKMPLSAEASKMVGVAQCLWGLCTGRGFMRDNDRL
jgi:hypothetical protein